MKELNNLAWFMITKHVCEEFIDNPGTLQENEISDMAVLIILLESFSYKFSLHYVE